MEVTWPPSLRPGAIVPFAVGAVLVSHFQYWLPLPLFLLSSFVPLQTSSRFSHKSKGSRGQENPGPKWSTLCLWEATQVMSVLDLTHHLSRIPRHPPMTFLPE